MAGPQTVLATRSEFSKGGRVGGKSAPAGERLWLHNEHATGLGGAGEGVNPEALSAMGRGHCFNGAALVVASQQKVDASTAIVKVDVGFGKDHAGLGLNAKITLSAPGLERAQEQELVEAAPQICPDAKPTRNNLPVELAVE
jgi:Ohr subfamily peroxiredoxin